MCIGRGEGSSVGPSGRHLKAKNSYHLNPSFMGPGLCGPADRRCPPDPQMALARLPSLARGRESCRASHPPKHGRPVRIHASWRTEMMNPGDPGNPGRGPMWSLHIPTTGPLAGIRLLCASPQGGISPAPLRTDRRDQLCVPTPISWMKLLQRATTQVSSRNQFPSRNRNSVL